MKFTIYLQVVDVVVVLVVLVVEVVEAKLKIISYSCQQ
jgi:hypothetical protein